MRLKLYFLVLILVTFFGCKKNKDVEPPEWQRSYLHILGATVLADSFDVTFDYYNVDDVVISNFYPKRNFPLAGYASLIAGGQPDEFGNGQIWLTESKKPFFNLPPDTLGGPEAIILDPDAKNTLALVDSGGKIFTVMIKDVYSTSATQAAIRFVHLTKNADAAFLRSSDLTISLSPVSFTQDNPFALVAPGVYTFDAVDNASSTVIHSMVDMEIKEGNVYTIYLSGGTPQLDYFRH